MPRKFAAAILLLFAATTPLFAQVGDRAEIDRGAPPAHWQLPAPRLFSIEESLRKNADRRVVPAVQEMALRHRYDFVRLHAWWTFEGLGALTPELVRRALQDDSAKVRAAGLRLCEPFLQDSQTARAVIAMTDDAQPEVRRQLIFTVGAGKGDEFHHALLAVTRRDLGRPVTVDAAVSGLRGRELATLERLLADAAWRTQVPAADRLYSALAQAVVNAGELAATERLLERVADASVHPAWPRLAMLDGLIAHPRHLGSLPAALTAVEKSGEEAIRTRAPKLKAAWAKAAVARANRGTNEALERGKALYPVCGACHGPEGKGQPGIAPPLDGSAIVAAASADELIKGILQDRNLDRQNKAFPDMPPFAGLPDEDIAGIASYVRAQWGPPSRPVPVGRVRQLRQEVAASSSGGRQ